MNDQFQQANPNEMELLAFRLGEQEYCIDIMSVREIRGWTNATPLPFSPAHVVGVINLRGTILPVLDLAIRLKMKATSASDKNVIIVVDVNNQTAGLLVDAVSDIISIAPNDLQIPPDLGNDDMKSCIRSLTLIENRLIRVLDLDLVIPQTTSENQ
ncbi:chemotaxis protein CheW [Paracoccus aminophilus]|uniref:Chemotaxis protein CheW n=1 Tax=Paracoccus aminophilus JCM 7686 TaxID=1367847 RepID=S5YT21_PARAH|nr:chemotaxis protein CheW [Paracoccus aminophilus]AGT08381.1 chemotaxis protein CheW [Paracoccus aminophilus JCM 7686]